MSKDLKDLELETQNFVIFTTEMPRFCNIYASQLKNMKYLCLKIYF